MAANDGQAALLCRVVGAFDSEDEGGIGIGVDGARLAPETVQEAVAVVGNADAVLLAGLQGFVGIVCTGAMAGRLNLINHERYLADVLIYKIVYHRVARTVHTEVVSQVAQELNLSFRLFSNRLRSLPTAGGSQQNQQQDGKIRQFLHNRTGKQRGCGKM